MARTARLPIAVDRYTPAYLLLKIRSGAELPPYGMQMQVRMVADTPGLPLIDLLAVTDDKQGIRRLSVEQVDGVTVTTFAIQIDRDAIMALPYAGELGDSTMLAYDLHMEVLGRQRVVAAGPFVVLPGVVGANAAPLGRPQGYGSGHGGAPASWSVAELSLSSDTFEITVDGVDQLGSIVAQAAAERAGAEAARDSAETFRDQAAAAIAGANSTVLLTLTSATPNRLNATMTQGSTIKPFATDLVVMAPAPPSGDGGIILEIAGFNDGDPRQLVRDDGSQIEGGAWEGGQRLVLYYDGIKFILVAPTKEGAGLNGGPVLLTQADAHPNYFRTTKPDGAVINPLLTDLVLVAPTTRTADDGGIILEIAGFNTGDPRQVRREDGSQIGAGAWIKGQRLVMYYDGAHFVLTSPAKAAATDPGGATGTSLTEYQLIALGHARMGV